VGMGAASCPSLRLTAADSAQFPDGESRNDSRTTRLEPEGVSGVDNLARWDPSMDRGPLAGSALDREYSPQMLDPLLHREQT
jgi:hypothetical protein